MKRSITLIATLICGIAAFAQTTERERDPFDEAFYRIYMHTASEDVSIALEAADSLYRSSKSDLQRVRSLMLISDMYHRVANRDSSLHYAETAGKLAEKFKLYEWQAKISGVLSTQYREIGLYTEGKNHLKKGLAAVEKVEAKPWVMLYRGQCHQELGYYAIEEEDFKAGIQFFDQAAVFFNDLPHSPSIDFSLAQNEERLGFCYLELELVDSAKLHYLNALELEQGVSEAKTPLKGFIYSGLGRVFLHQEALADAFGNLEKALEIAEVTNFPHLKISVYRNLSFYYKAISSHDDYIHYNELYLAEVRKNVAAHKKYADNVLVAAQQNLVTMVRTQGVLVSVVVFSFLLALIGAVIYNKKQKQNRARFKSIIKELRQERPSVTALVPVDVETRELVPEATKVEILKKLRRFENSLDFTNKNMSIAVLAGKMKTNTKYLSYVVNNVKHKDFNSYINELRINYIVSKMEKDPRYLHYKISYLAEECGFSTHSQFTTIFKNILGLSPSKFMEYLKKGYHEQEDVLEQVG